MLSFSIVTSMKGSYLTNTKGQLQVRSFWQFEMMFPIILFSIFFGVRYDVGTDYLTYLYGYIDHIDVGKGEYLFKNITRLFQYFNLHFAFYFGVLAFIQIFFFFYAFNRQRFLFPFLILFFFSNVDFLFLMNGIRQALAMCIWIFSLKYIEQRKFWKYLFWCLVAFGFHLSAVTLIIFYPILKNSKDYFKSVTFQLVLLGSVFIIQQFFKLMLNNLMSLADSYQSLVGDGKYTYQQDNFTDSIGKIQGSGLAYLFKILINVAIICYSVKLKKFYHNIRWFRIAYFFFFIGLLTLYIFPVGSIVLTRPFRYFYIFQTIMYAYFAYYLSKNKSWINTILFYTMIIAFLGIFYLDQITSSPNSHLWYQFYFDNVH
jgi:hypothetical protein